MPDNFLDLIFSRATDLAHKIGQNQVGSYTQPLARLGGLPKPSRRSGTQAQRAHALGHCLVVNWYALEIAA